MPGCKHANLLVQAVSAPANGYIRAMDKTVQIDDDVMCAAERLAAERRSASSAPLFDVNFLIAILEENQRGSTRLDSSGQIRSPTPICLRSL